MTVIGAFLALGFELLAGYPDWLMRSVGHPAIWLGKLIGALDDRWNQPGDAPATRRTMGVLALALLLLLSISIGALLQWTFLAIPFGFIPLALIASTLLAQRSLYAHVAAVAAALERNGLMAGRRAVSQIVGRDVEELDDAGVSRAAIESLAENFSDAVVAPVFWLAVGGLPAGLAYKAVNTADSMIGHKTPRHKDFGRAAARFDDLVNLPASRLTALLLIMAAPLMPGASFARALQSVRRDATGHRSPNAGWPEAAMAGALGLALAGPRSYDGTMIDDAVMGIGGRRDAGAGDIRRALRLFMLAEGILVMALGSLAALAFYIMT